MSTSTALSEDQVNPPADGELFVRAIGRDGHDLANPYAIFKFPQEARRFTSLPVPSDIPLGYLPLGANLVVDGARQILANLAGGRDHDANKRWVVGKVSFGTYDTVPRFTDITLSPQPDTDNSIVGGENEIEISAGVRKKPVLSVDYPQDFVVRWEVLLEADEAVGYLIREMGLWTNGNPGGGGETLFARKTFPAVNKSGDFALSWLWRVRM